MNVVVKGIGQTIANIDKRTRQYKVAADKGVVMTAAEIQREAVLSINKPSQGIRYKRKNGRYHVASRKGEAPNTDKGGLIRSIAVSHIKLSQVAYVYTNLAYGAILELIKDRPWLRPAMEAKKGNLKDNIQAQINKVTKL